MPHTLDAQPLESGAATLSELLAEARAALGAGRIVVEVRAGGEVLSAEEIEARMSQPLRGGELSLVSADASALATDALDAALDRLGVLGDLQADAAEKLQADEPGEAFARLGEALSAWIQVSTAVSQSCQLLGLDLATLVAGGGGTGAEAAEELAARLRELREQLEARDTIALGDSLGYVWPGLIDRWQGLVGGLQARIGEADPAA